MMDQVTTGRWVARASNHSVHHVVECRERTVGEHRYHWFGLCGADGYSVMLHPSAMPEEPVCLPCLEVLWHRRYMLRRVHDHLSAMNDLTRSELALTEARVHEMHAARHAEWVAAGRPKRELGVKG